MRTVSNAAIQGMLARETDKVFLVCLRIKHPSIQTIHLVNDTQDLHRSDAIYTAFPFTPIFPDETDGQIAQAQITLANIDETIGKTIQDISGRGTVEMEVVLATSPNVIEVGPISMQVGSAQMTAQSVILSLTVDDEFLNQQVPGVIYTPINSKTVY